MLRPRTPYPDAIRIDPTMSEECADPVTATTGGFVIQLGWLASKPTKCNTTGKIVNVYAKREDSIMKLIERNIVK